MKKLYLGYFSTPEQASEAYKKAALKYFGEFASSSITDVIENPQPSKTS